MPLIAHAPTVSTVAISEFLLQEIALFLFTRSRRSRRDTFLLANRLLSGTHSLVLGSLALVEILKPHWQHDDLIRTKSAGGDIIVASELGFLLQDTIFLLFHRKGFQDTKLLRRVLAHHLIFGGLTSWYLEAVHAGYAAGIFFVSAFMIMNLSNPLRYLSWAIKKYYHSGASKRRILLSLHITALGVYAASRLGLIYYLIWVYGQRKGLSVVQSYNSLPFQCRFTTGLIAFGNAIRLLQISPFKSGPA